MTTEHVSTERLYDDIGLTPDEVAHVRDCSGCREVLTVLTRHKRLRLQKLASGSAAQHVPLAELWQHRRGKDIDGTYRTHLGGCELCTDILDLCRRFASLQEVIPVLKKYGVKIE